MDSLLTVAGREIRLRGRWLRTAFLHGDKYRFLDDPQQVIDGLRRLSQRIDLFTFLERIPFEKARFDHPIEWDNLAVQPITGFETWWESQVDCKTRNMVRKAEKKGVVTREVALDDALLDGIWTIYNESPVRQGKAYPHFGKDRRAVFQEEATHLDHSVFLGAFLDSHLIGFAKLVVDERGTQAGLMNILSLIEHREKAPTNALIAQAVKSCSERGIRYLTYSNFSYGKKQRDSLSDFKKNNGFQKIDLPRYYVPLTPIGWIAFKFGLHRGFGNYVPESAAARIRDYRAAWHKRDMKGLAGGAPR